MERMIGKWSFIIGVLLAIIAGIVPQLQTATVAWVFVILGLIIGLLNIAEKETTEFLVAAIALMTVGAAGLATVKYVGSYIQVILTNIIVIVAPAALIVALKAVYSIGQMGEGKAPAMDILGSKKKKR